VTGRKRDGDAIVHAEVVAPCYPDDDCLAGVRELVEQLERRGVESVVEWEGTQPLAEVGTRAVPI
jgi:hypothetical protein